MKKYGLICPIRKANPYRRMAKAMATNNYHDNILNREFCRLAFYINLKLNKIIKLNKEAPLNNLLKI